MVVLLLLLLRAKENLPFHVCRVTRPPLICGISVCPKAVVFERGWSRRGKRKTENSFKKKKMNLSCIFKTEKLALSKVNEKELILFFSERDLKANPFMILKS